MTYLENDGQLTELSYNIMVSTSWQLSVSDERYAISSLGLNMMHFVEYIFLVVIV